MAGAYQLGGMPGSDPYAAAAFGMQPQPDPAMFQAYQHANGATLATLMRPNGGTPGGANAATSAVAAQSGSGNAVTTTPAGPPTNSASQINGKQGTAQQTEGDSIANVNTIDKGTLASTGAFRKRGLATSGRSMTSSVRLMCFPFLQANSLASPTLHCLAASCLQASWANHSSPKENPRTFSSYLIVPSFPLFETV
jgi:hypothetical protein